ncbi:UNVERIFIED_CONTAM: hypothetical protein K2H54_006111 [Gekko kuhli]
MPICLPLGRWSSGPDWTPDFVLLLRTNVATHLKQPGQFEERGGPRLKNSTSEDSLVALTDQGAGVSGGGHSKSPPVVSGREEERNRISQRLPETMAQKRSFGKWFSLPNG